MLRDIPPNVQSGVESLLDSRGIVRLLDFTFSGGGCINQGGRLTTSSGNFFLKWNDAKKFPEMFRSEAAGLGLLKDNSAIHIPDVVGFGEEGNSQFLVLSFIEQRTINKRYWEDFGYHLALMHQMKSDSYGLDHNNYMGSLRQYNTLSHAWTDFFIDMRLRVQVKLACDSGLMDLSTGRNFELLFAKLPAILPFETPCLVHGDLWRGNLIADENGEAALIDPAVYYGSREIDLAMTHLFGGFDDAFYGAYENEFPLIAGYADRVDIYNLYPLLVHLNLFGISYLRGIKDIIRRFV